MAGQFIRAQFKAQRIPCNVPLALSFAEILEKALWELHVEIAQHTPANRTYVRNIIHNLLIALGRAIHAPPGEVRPPREYQEVKAYLEEHFAERLIVPQLAARVHRSVPRFTSRFKAFFGVPPMEYLIQLRMLRAMYLLHDQNLSVAEIGRQAGCDNPHYFSRLFRKRFGICPAEARRRLVRASA